MRPRSLLPVLLVLFLLVLPESVFAFSMGTSGYTLDQSTIDLGAPTPTAIIPKGPQYVYPSATPVPESSYTITVPKSGGLTNDSFGMTLDSDFIDFGPLSPSDQITRQTILSITAGKSFGYGLFVSEDSPLRNTKGDTIPDTSCDQGSCNETVAAVWASVLSYGFGYRCDNPLLCSDFGDTNTFMRFPKTNTMTQSLVSRGHRDEDTILPLLYRLNTAATQPKAQYSNIITILAIPAI